MSTSKLPEESVWSYPRPPIVEPAPAPVRIEHAGHVLVQTERALRVLETSHPPTYYVPPDDVDLELLRPSSRRSYCEFKGRASYHDLIVSGHRVRDVAWSYPAPAPAFASLAGYFAFYPGRLDAAWVGGERVRAQEGDFYGGWITGNLRGPFKGGPGTTGW